MQLIIVTILLLVHDNPTATIFTSSIYLYKVKRLSNMPKNLRRQYSDTIYKPNAVLVFYTCCVFSTYHR